MKEALLQFFGSHPALAVFISLAVSVLVAVIGVLPSFFITAANILFFGFWKGVGISFLGEAVGAVVAFGLYRREFKKEVADRLNRYPKVARLVNAEGPQAFGLVLSLRLIPFVPSGLVTFAAAIGRVSPLTFTTASSVGKLPALLLEGYAVYEVTEARPEGRLILAVVAVALFYLAAKQIQKRNNVEG